MGHDRADLASLGGFSLGLGLIMTPIMQQSADSPAL